MEYTFKNSWSEKASTIVLTDLQLTMQCAGSAPEVIPYSSVSGIRLFRGNQDAYFLYIYPEHGKPLMISNRYCLSAKETEDRSRQYVTFVRVLHLHLKNKNDTAFTTGFSSGALVIRGASAITCSLLLAFAVEFIFPGVLNPWGLAGAFLVFLTLLLYILERNRLPQYYRATDIPLEFLP